jgi:putative transposase
LLLFVARSTESELAKQVEFLKAEKHMLRKCLPKRVRLTSDEKKLLVKLGQAMGTGITALLSIVAYSTYRVGCLYSLQKRWEPCPGAPKARAAAPASQTIPGNSC